MAQASDKVLYESAPAWVKPAPLPDKVATPASDVPLQLLLNDEQVKLEPGVVTTYHGMAFKILTAQGLAAGNISLAWRPETADLIVHRLVIRRDGKTIDVLAGGQTFTVVRRETNLDSVVLDGTLTANIQPEGLQVGDILEMAVSIAAHDPVINRDAETLGAVWNDVPIDRAHFRAQWPSSFPVQTQASESLLAAKPVRAGDVTTLDFSATDIVPLVKPKGAPLRYQLGRRIELSSFADWADVAAVFAPLFDKAAVLPKDGSLRAEVARIEAASADDKTRAGAALALVEDKVRYVALAMGSGGLVPADAATTWSRRFGDCKGKTALLMAILHELGIEAQPVLVSTVFGDGLDQRLPGVGVFNHVITRATIGGKTYWLDGTRTGDTALDRLTVPDFGWGLPVQPRGATLVRMLPPPLTEPSEETAIHIDAKAGLMVPAPVTVTTTWRGDAAIAIGVQLAALTGAARDRALRDYWKSQYDFIDLDTVDSDFDTKTGIRRLTMTGRARMDWSSGWYETDGMGVGYKADFSRDPGPNRDAPFAVAYPLYDRVVETIDLPPGFPDNTLVRQGEVDKTLAGVAYYRHAAIKDRVFTAERTTRALAPEFPAKDAPEAQAGLRDLADQTLYIRKPATYQVTTAELDIWQKKTLTSDDAYLNRGLSNLQARRYEEAIGDFTAGLALNPRGEWLLANRGIAYAWTGKTDLARADLSSVEAIDAKNPVLWRARGLLAQQAGDSAAAVAAFDKAISFDPNSSFAFYHRALAQRTLGNTDAALADAGKAIALEPSMVDAYTLRANAFRDKGDTAAIAAEAKAVTTANPQITLSHVAAAKFYRSMGDQSAAMKEIDKAIAIEPQSYIYVNRAEIRPKDDFADRLADLDKALALDPKSIGAQGAQGAQGAKADILMDSGRFDDAVAYYDTLVSGNPKSTNWLLGRSIAKFRAGKVAAGEADFASASALATSAVQLNNLCYSVATYGFALDRAAADCEKAVTMAPDNPAIIDSYGFVLLRRNQLDAALAAYDRAIAKAPTQATSLYGRGLTRSRMGDQAKAALDFAAAIKSDPDIAKEFEGYGMTP